MSSKGNAAEQKNKKKRKPFRYFLYDFIKITGALGAYFWLRPKRLFASKAAKKHVRGGAVVIANHTKITDPVALYFAFWYRRVHIMAMEELFHTKMGNWFFCNALCIPVNRENFSIDSFRSAVEVLEENGVLAIFPEGKINSDTSTVNSFKSGALLMALRGNAPIVPVFLVAPKKWYNRAVIVIGAPVDLKAICGDVRSLNAINEVSQKLREKEIELMEIYSTWKTRKSSK